MKRYKIVSLALVLLIGSAIVLEYSFNPKKNMQQPVKTGKNRGFAVVELFTSEGCSSCPPADEAIAKLVSRQLENVYVLCFHVDYWNRLGWEDPFSQALFSKRQNEYARNLSLKSLYTPQVVINGTSQFVGSNESRLNTTIAQSLRSDVKVDFRIDAKRSKDLLSVAYTAIEDDVLLNLALVEPSASVVVKRGENSGKTLHHVNIVRVFHQADVKGTGTLSIKIPQNLSAVPLRLIAYTQSKKNARIVGAEEKYL